MVLDVLQDTSTTNVVSTGDEDGGTVIEFDNTLNFLGLEVVFDGVVLLDVWVWETDGAAIVGDHVWDLVLAQVLLGDLEELELGLLLVDGVWHETTLNVVEHAEVLASLVKGDDVHEAEWVLVVTLDLAINLDLVLLVLHDLKSLLLGKSVL